MRLEAKYLTVQELNARKGYPIAALCRVVGLNRSSYYKWLRRGEPGYILQDAGLSERIAEIYSSVRGIYGYRRIRLSLRRKFNLSVNHKRVYRLMKAIGLQSVIRRKRKGYARSSPAVIAENILGRQFSAQRPNEKWLTDVTEFCVGNGSKLYLSAILDLGGNSVLAYKTNRSNNNELVFQTLDSAVAAHPDAHPLFHSDRGFQYTNRVFHTKLTDAGITQSMSRVGRCLDNGPMEAFWGTLKAEMFFLRKFSDSAELAAAIDEYIRFYNNERYQEGLGGLAPAEYRALF